MCDAAWRAPETFNTGAGRQVASPATDVFMFGCMMLEALTCKRPWFWLPDEELMRVRLCFPERNPFDDAKKDGMLTYAVDWARNPLLQGQLEELLRKCVSQSAEARPSVSLLLHTFGLLRSNSYAGYV